MVLLEGNTSLIPLLDSILDAAGELSAFESVLPEYQDASASTHIACKHAYEVVAGFEDVDPRSVRAPETSISRWRNRAYTIVR